MLMFFPCVVDLQSLCKRIRAGRNGGTGHSGQSLMIDRRALQRPIET
ncbi:hypothetical protein [Crateriforma conspicua]|nr:hypothetical protein [Crateriforma conspicua]